jgi:hypothetical protein
MFEDFELVEEDHDYIIVDKEHATRQTLAIHAEKRPTIHRDYELLLHQNKIISNQLTKMVYSLEKAGVTGNNRDLWVAAANCVIKCMADVIIEGEKLINDSTVKT